MHHNTERWEVHERPVSAPRRARNVLRRGYDSLPHLAVTQLLHRVPLIRSAPNRSGAVGERRDHLSLPSGGMANRSAFAGYSILRPLGSGGMADVYLAKHPRLPRRDALKILATGMTADDEFRERFNREADLAATLFHPHIVAVHDRGEFDGQLWIAMDYVEAPTQPDWSKSVTAKVCQHTTPPRSSLRSPVHSTTPMPGECCTATSSPPTSC